MSSPTCVLVSVKEAAIYLAVSKRTIWRLLAEGTLPRVRLASRVVRIRRADLDRMVGRIAA